MADVQWYHIAIPLLSGGAMGAIINAIVASMRNRIQKIGSRMDTIPVFKQKLGESSLSAKITISDGTTEYHFDNLFLIDVQIVNQGNRDVKQFPLGITLTPGDKAVFVEFKPPDRYHKIDQITSVTPKNPTGEIDFVLRPFNRRDSYFLKLYVVIPEGKEEPGKMQLGSSQPVRFTYMPTIGEMVALAAKSTFFAIGPLKISIREK